jgi:hypothetical protein
MLQCSIVLRAQCRIGAAEMRDLSTVFPPEPAQDDEHAAGST